MLRVDFYGWEVTGEKLRVGCFLPLVVLVGIDHGQRRRVAFGEKGLLLLEARDVEFDRAEEDGLCFCMTMLFI